MEEREEPISIVRRNFYKHFSEYPAFLETLLTHLEEYGLNMLAVPEARREILQLYPLKDRILDLHDFHHNSIAGSEDEAIDTLLSASWHPGKAFARKFCRCLKLPNILIDGTKPLGSIIIRGLSEISLRPHSYQQSIIEQLETIESDSANTKAMVCLPTGTGKTFMMLHHILKNFSRCKEPQKAFVVVPSAEIGNQWEKSAIRIWRSIGAMDVDLQLIRHWGNYPSDQVLDGSAHKLIIGTNRKYNLDASKIEFLRDKVGSCHLPIKSDIVPLDSFILVNILNQGFNYAIVDEAHHATAKTYLWALKDVAQRAYGLSATPYRGTSTKFDEETTELSEVFDGARIVPKNNSGQRWVMRDFQEAGYLSHVDHLEPISLSDLQPNEKEIKRFKQYNEPPPEYLSRLGDYNKRSSEITDHMIKYNQNRPDLKALYFGISVSHVKKIAEDLNNMAVSSKAIDGGTEPSERKTTIAKFRKGEIKILCLCNLYREGFDIPEINTIFMGRPTKSAVFYEQMIGRGIRGPRNGGTERCTVIDYKDNISEFGELMSYDRVLGYWKDWENAQ